MSSPLWGTQLFVTFNDPSSVELVSSVTFTGRRTKGSSFRFSAFFDRTKIQNKQPLRVKMIFPIDKNSLSIHISTLACGGSRVGAKNIPPDDIVLEGFTEATQHVENLELKIDLEYLEASLISKD